MTQLVVVKTLSELAIASSASPTSSVDIALIADPDGLPYIPARRVKSMLRESWSQIAPAFPELRGAATELLSEAGVTTPDVAPLHLRSLCLAPAVHEGYKIAAAAAADGVQQEAVRATLSTVRTLTSRDRTRLGAPRVATLRTLEVLRPGVEFSAPIDMEPYGAEHRRVLAAACLNLRRIGLHRNRGLGRVEVRIKQDDHTDITRAWLVATGGSHA